MQPLPEPGLSAITLDPAALPGYAARTTLRMLAAMVLSLLFIFTYATWAAKSRRAEVVLIPLVPILDFISVSERQTRRALGRSRLVCKSACRRRTFEQGPENGSILPMPMGSRPLLRSLQV